MKIFRQIILYTVMICLVMYLGFLYILPNCLDFAKYSKSIEDALYRQTGYKFVLVNPKIFTSPNLCLSAQVERADVFDNNKKFSQVNNLKINISLLPLFFKTVKITDFTASKLMVEVPEKITLPEPVKTDFIFFKKLPNVNIDYFRISFNSNRYSLKGNDFSFYDNLLTKKQRISAKGGVYTGNNENITYDFDLLFNLKNKEKNQSKTDIADVSDLFRNLEEYGVRANVVVKGDIEDKKGGVHISGFSFIGKGKRFPDSFLSLFFDKNKFKINSEIYTEKTKKIDVSGSIDPDTEIDLKINSDDINIKDLLIIAKIFGKISGIKEIEHVFATGLLKANFNVKSDFKNFASNGKMHVKGVNVSYKGYSLNNLNSEVDFSDNMVKVRDASAKFENYPVLINGSIDNKVNTNFVVTSENIQIKDVVDKNILKENTVSGTASFKGQVRGNLKNPEPKLEIKILNAMFKNKQTGVVLKNNETKISSDGKDTDIRTFNTIIAMPDNINSILIPRVNAKLKEDRLETERATFWINNIKAELTGSLSDIFNKVKLNDVKILIPNQANVTMAKNAKISIQGDLTLNGYIDNPQPKGHIEISKLTIPSDAVNIQNISIVADKDIRINCPYIDIGSSIIRLNAYTDKLPDIKNVNINAEYLDVNKLSSLAQKQTFMPTVLNGTLKAGKVKVDDIYAENVVSKLSVRNNILKLGDLTADAYQGKLAASITHNVPKNYTDMTLQGRGVDSNELLKALSGRAQDIRGRCDFDSRLKFHGDKKSEIQKSLNGDVKFIIHNFASDSLGKLDYLIQAQNIITNRAMQSYLNIMENALKLKDTGVYQSAKGEIHLDKEIAYIKSLKLAGPTMSLYINGRYRITDDVAFLIILGRVSDDIIPKSEREQKHIPVIGTVASAFLPDITTSSDIEDILKIPDLTVKTQFKTQEFKVLINGKADKQTSVQSFKWIRQGVKPLELRAKQEKSKLPEFIDSLPEFNQ